MTAPVDAGRAVTSVSTAAATWTVNLPSSIANGDRLLMLLRVASADALVRPSGWNALVDGDTSDGADDITYIWYRDADGSEGTTVDVDVSGATAKGAAIAWRVTGGASGAPNISSIATGSSNTPDSPNLAPAAGSDDYLWFTLAGWDGETTVPPTYPTGYDTNGVATGSLSGGSVTTNCRIAGGSQAETASSENPPSFLISGSRSWSAWTIAYAPPAVADNRDQVGWRARNDDGNETGATWKAAENTDWNQAEDENFRIRFVVDETAGGDAPSTDYKYQYNLNGAGWNDVTATSTVVRASASAQVANGTATTRQLSSGTGTFRAGAVDTNNGAFGLVDLAAGELTELEGCAQVRSADTTPGDTIQLRVFDNTAGAALEAYTEIPTITVGAATEINGSGDADLMPIAASGAGDVIVSGTGDADLLAISSSGAGDVDVAGTGDADLMPISASGAGDVIVSGAGDADLMPIQASGSGDVLVQSTAGDADLMPINASGTGTLGNEINGSGDADLMPISASGSGTVEVAGTGDADLMPISASGAGDVDVAGAGDADLMPLAASGDGGVVVVGSGDADLMPIAASGAGVIVTDNNGAGALDLEPIAASGVGTVVVVATGELDLLAIGTVRSRASVFNTGGGVEAFEVARGDFGLGKNRKRKKFTDGYGRTR